MSKKSLVSLILIFILMFTSIVSANAQVLEYLDTEGHWAEKEILKWSSEGLLQGYQGYFRPNDNITKAEVATIIDNLMKYQEVGQNTFADLKDTWYTEAVLKNVKAGTMTDVEGQLKVEELATRQEVVVMFAKAFGIDPTEGPTSFNDDKQIADTARGYILSFYNKGYIVGMPSGDFEPESNIRRASIVKIFDNILAECITEKGQVTGTYEGTVIINSPDVVLKDSTISGDLIIAPGVGEGEATINNTQVKGSFIVNGGGKNSIAILGNSSFEGIIIKKQGVAVRVVAEEGIVVPEIVIAGQSNVIIDGKAEYKNVKVVGAESVEIRQGTAIKEIVVEAKAVAIDNSGKIENVQITEKAEGSVISGKGSIEEVLVKADNIIIEAEITKVIVEEGIKGTLVDGKEIEGGTQVDKKKETSNTPVETPSVVNPPSSGGGTPSTPTPTDQVAPVITLTTNKLMSATVNVIAEQPDWTKYFSVTDNRDGAITVTASMISGTVDITKVGDYNITLNARDAAGNTASKTITFKMKDTYMAGDGLSAATAYEIESIEDLALIGSGYIDDSKQYALNSYYKLVRDLDFESDDSYENPNIKDTRDRDGDGDVDETLKLALTALNSGKGFVPITMSNAGNIASPFSGTIDGNGHTISKLYINIPTHDQIGFIGRGDGVSVKNLKITAANVTGQNRVGILVGSINNGTVTDSSAEGTLNIKAGLAGLLAGESQSSTITNSSTKGSVNGIGTGPEFLNRMLGGLIGSSSDTEITNCHSLTNVNGLNDIGGLIGKDSNSKVDQSSSNGTINGEDSIGGLVGLSSGTTVENSNAKGTVTGTRDVGGLIGKIDGGIYQYNSSSATITGDASVGGLIGNIQTDSGNVGVLNSYATGNVTGKTKVGGLVGSYYQFPTKVITIAYCYSSGDVHGDPNYASSSGIGGLIGQTRSGTISNSIAYNNIITSKPGVANRFIGVTEGSETLQSNYAKSDMTINSVVGTSGTGSDVNGADVSVSQFSTAAFFTSTNNWSDKVWDFNYIWQINNGEKGPTHTKVSTRVDTTPPEIRFGFSNVDPFYTLGQISTEPDWTGLFKVKDDLDGDITVTQAMITENVDITKAGVYPITINVSDAAGNTATTTYNMRIMANAIPPVITVDTSKKKVFYKGVDTVKPDWKSYFTANDDADGPITIIDSMITDSVDLSTVGTYSIIVTCNDSSGNTGQKTISIEVKEDSVGPTVGNSGIISVSNIGTTGLTLNWTKATDNASIASNLIYEAYLSTSNNLDTVSNTETNGTLIGSASTDIATVDVTGLNPDTTYYFNIIVKDQIGNKSLYSTKTQKTNLIPDTEAPAVGNSGTMTITNVDVTGLTLNWTKATDNISASTALTYQAYYSTSNNLDTISNTETNGTSVGTASADIGTINVTGLSEDTTYYFNVIVSDEAGNKSVYTSLSQKTNLSPDTTAPVVGNSGAITVSNLDTTGLTLSWTKATDNRSGASGLSYQAYYSTSNNLDTISNIKTNGTTIGSATTDIAIVNVTSLTEDTTYYFNVIVTDEAGNESMYTTMSQKTNLTPDIEAPTVGNSGTITASNVAVTGLTLNWTKAADNRSASTALTYQAYYSTSNNLDTVSNTETNGTPIGTASADIAIIDVTGLNEDTTYYFNVIVTDEAGNKSMYTSFSQKTNLSPDTTAPVAGDSGTITGSNVGANGLTLNWTKATDNRSLATALTYQVYYSTSNNIDTVANVTTNGTPFASAAADIASVNVTGLNSDTSYYFNVLVKDEAGNQAAYTTKSLATLDTVAPVVGNSGNMTVSNVDITSLTLNWTKATDNKSASTALTYQAYYSTSNNLDTVSNTETNGTSIGTASADIATIDVTGLSEDTTYYFNVIVSDEAGNKSLYTSQSQKTNLSPDTTAPVVGNSGSIAGSNISASGLTLNWTKATDNRSLATALTYQVYYSTSNNIDTVANMTTNGTPFASAAADIASVNVTGLNSDTTYYFNVLVKDEAGNQAVYSMQMLQTTDTLAPTVGNSGTISGSNANASGLTVNWTKATDNRSSASALTYQVYYSSSNNIDTVTNMTTNGTAFASAVADIASVNVTGLNSDTSYYFNVLVTDEAGNQAAYTMQALATLDTVAPVVGNSGTLVGSSIGANSLTLNWAKASDNKSAVSALTYQVYYSTTNNIDTLSNITTNGTAFASAAADIETINVTGLTANTDYYFNVLVKDEAGNQAVYAMQMLQTADTQAPTVGNSGVLSGSNISTSGLTLNWTKATDNKSLATALTYQVYYSTSNNIDTVADVTTNGTPFASASSDIATINVTGLTANTDYYFNVLVADEAGNQAVYTMQMLQTTDTLAPTVSDTSVSTSNITGSGLTLSFMSAMDNRSAANALAYQAYYSNANNIDNVANMIANGTAFGSPVNDAAIINVSGLTQNTTYYFNILVTDEAGNHSAYAMQTALTADTEAPSAGNSGTISGSSITTNSLTLNWTKASDNKSLATALTYQAYYSTSNNIDSVANMTNGTPIGSTSADISTVDVSGLNPNTDYYFNVLVTDEAGNQAVYTMQMLQTLDTIAPTVGNSGSITGLNPTASGITLNWTKATDNRSSASGLTYQVYYSASNNIDTVANVTANGTPFGVATADIATIDVTGLNSDTSYYFNVLVTDEAGNKAVYTMQMLQTADTLAPTIGDATLSVSSITGNSMTLSWNKASDNMSPDTALTYQAYYSTSNNLDTISNIETNGTSFGSASADISSVNINGLSDITTYYLNVIVTDQAGNKAMYTTVTAATSDTTGPVFGNGGAFSLVNGTGTNVTVSWTAATDNLTAASDLEYLVYHSNDQSTYVPFGTYEKNITTKTVTGLDSYTNVYFKIYVRDAAGNITSTGSNFIRTNDVQPPTIVDGNLTLSIDASNNIQVDFVLPSDYAGNIDSLYVGYSETQSDVDNLAGIISYYPSNTSKFVFGNQVGVSTAGQAILTTYPADTTIYINILAEDFFGNRSIYNVASIQTPNIDKQPPVPGANASFNGATVTWDPAVDDSGGDITYTLYYSDAYSLNTLSAIEQYGGSPIATLTNDTSYTLTTPTFGNIGIVASDSSGNKAAYNVNNSLAQE